MLTTIILDGPMGKHFGRKWELVVNSPNEALRMIDANKPGLFAWIKMNIQKYSRYKIICKFEDGREEHLIDEEYQFERKCKSIRFVPVVEGASGVFRAVLGIVMIVVGFVLQQPWLVNMGASMLISGIAAMLAPKPQKQEQTERKDKTSYFFDGPTNTTVQGVPVQLIYGRCLVGSHAISAKVSVDQLM
jgi:predicted phage tail protein